jgi:hypothetical protein
MKEIDTAVGTYKLGDNLKRIYGPSRPSSYIWCIKEINPSHIVLSSGNKKITVEHRLLKKWEKVNE